MVSVHCRLPLLPVLSGQWFGVLCATSTVSCGKIGWAQPGKYSFTFYVFIGSMCVSTHDMHIEVKGQTVGSCSFLLPYEFWESNLGITAVSKCFNLSDGL